MKLSIIVTLKKEVLDPQGKVIKQTLNYMGFRGALCENKEIRNSNISISAVKNIINKIKNYKNFKISA